MRFVSYAQNFEDVMLWRALRHVRGGFYIDVGANDPVKDSVTKAFSERGWRGINVEPVAAHHADLERDRPLDVNLHCAVGAADGSIALWECDVPGLATTDPAVAQQHEREGRPGRWYDVPVRTLAAVCEQHAQGGEIHFLKIDVEGGEASVLRGADFGRFRPWIVVVEATRPNSTQQRHEEWEHLLTGAGYRFAYADGLNRFYLAQEHEELAAALAYPPNVFDQFIVAQQFNAELWWKRADERAHELQKTVDRLDQRLGEAAAGAAAADERALQFSARATEAETRTQEYVARAARAEERAAHLADLLQSAQRTVAARERQLQEATTMLSHVHASTSWRITKPLRAISAWLKGERSLRAMRADLGAAAGSPRSSTGSGRPVPPPAEPLPPRAREAYAEMKSAADAAKGS